ncbi:OmpA family protein [Fuscibacter oryzae]|uniref:OmpA-like domain-containing protein n=1 Tax=Fuscibacter oryzae TaxID=2803939 RepID=A0A8J7MPT1_9RHOB|nr:hypothetical protein [Fuscibacter oryzae]MBL4927783.1 hypothetical protein [Fuscibacter oryzae]
MTTAQDSQLRVILPEGITSPTGSDVVQRNFLPALGEVARSRNAHPNSTLRVFGHTNNVSSDASKRQPSQGRAPSVSRADPLWRGLEQDPPFPARIWRANHDKRHVRWLGTEPPRRNRDDACRLTMLPAALRRAPIGGLSPVFHSARMNARDANLDQDETAQNSASSPMAREYPQTISAPDLRCPDRSRNFQISVIVLSWVAKGIVGSGSRKDLK